MNDLIFNEVSEEYFDGLKGMGEDLLIEIMKLVEMRKLNNGIKNLINTLEEWRCGR